MNKDEVIKDIAKMTCEFETPCNECEFNSKKYRCSYKAYAEQVYNAGYRKVADDDEIVESMKTYERARQETAREILQDLNNRYNECGGAVDVAIMLYDWLLEMGKKYDIELE